jgi:hypothetical protein
MGIPMMSDTETAVRERAYALWEASGRPEGRDKDHWFQAVKEVTFAVPPPGTITKLRQAAKAAARGAGKK